MVRIQENPRAGGLAQTARVRNALHMRAALLGTALLLAGPAQAVSWILDADGNWNLPANWSTGLLPGALDDVLIDVGGATVRRITHASGMTNIRSLTSAEELWITGGTLSVSGSFSNTANTQVGGTLRLDGTATLATLDMVNGTIDGVGTVTVRGPAFKVGNTLHRGAGTTRYEGSVTPIGGTPRVRLDGGRTLEFAGGYTTGPTSADFDLDFTAADGGGVLRNASGSTFLDQANASRIWARFGGPAKFENFGTFRKDGADFGETNIETSFANLGTVEAIRGQINVIGSIGGPDATTLVGGKWVVEARSETDFGRLYFHSSSLESLVTNAADITLIGAGARDGMRFGTTFALGSGTTVDAALRKNAAGGAIRLIDGAIFTVGPGDDFINDGEIELFSSVTLSSSFSVAPGVVLVNNGTIFGRGDVLANFADSGVQNNGTIRSEGGRLNIVALTLSGGTVATGADSSLWLTIDTVPTVDRIDHQGIMMRAITPDNGVINVRSDYTNAFFGEGDAFNRNANGVAVDIRATSASQVLSADGLTSGDTATPVLVLGNRRVGDASPVVVTIANGGTETTLRGAVRTAGAPLLDVTGGESFMITPGGTAQFAISAAGLGPGAFGGQSVVVANNFTNVADQTLSISGQIFRLAEAEVIGPTLPMVVRVGDTLPAAIRLANVALADGFSEGLVVTGSTTGNLGLINPASLIVLAGQSRDTSALIDTTTAGLKTGSIRFEFGSGGPGSSGLDPIGIGGTTIDISVMVNSLAVPVFTRNGTALAFDPGLGGYLLDLGTLAVGGAFLVEGLGLGNLVLGPADDLSGMVALLSGTPWSMGGAFDIGLLAAGAISDPFSLTLDTSARGLFLGELLFSGRGTNLSDPDGVERVARLFLRASVADAQGVIPEPDTWAMMIIGFGAVGLAARRRARLGPTLPSAGRSR